MGKNKRIITCPLTTPPLLPCFLSRESSVCNTSELRPTPAERRDAERRLHDLHQQGSQSGCAGVLWHDHWWRRLDCKSLWRQHLPFISSFGICANVRHLVRLRKREKNMDFTLMQLCFSSRHRVSSASFNCSQLSCIFLILSYRHVLVFRCSSVVRTASLTSPGSGVTIESASETWRMNSGLVRLSLSNDLSSFSFF